MDNASCCLQRGDFKLNVHKIISNMKATHANGQELEASWLTDTLTKSLSTECDVGSYKVLKHMTGAHSSTMKLQLHCEKIPSVYWKRVVVRDLPAKAPYKLIRDVNSYITEALVYERVSTELNQKGVRTPYCYYAQKKIVESDLTQSEFLLLLEDLTVSGFAQRHIHLNKGEIIACVKYLADLHGLYWNKVDSLQQIPQSGTYWTYDKRPTGEVDTIPEKWNQFCERFESVSTVFNDASIINLGDRLVKQLPWIKQQRDNIPNHTFVHGDFKSANIFLNENNTVATIDWQWSGVGHGISDVMYLLLGAYNMGLGQDNFALEREILQHYTQHLLQNYGVTYSIEDALTHFKLSVLDFSRIILAYFFDGQTPQSIEACASDPGELTHTSSLEHLVDLVRYLNQLLQELEFPPAQV